MRCIIKFRTLQLQRTVCCIRPQIHKRKLIDSISVLSINNIRDHEQFNEPAVSVVTRKIDSDGSR